MGKESAISFWGYLTAPKLTKLSRSLNGTGNFALHDGSTYSSPPTVGEYAQPGACENPGLRADSIRPYGSSEEPATIHPTTLLRKTAGGFYPSL